MKTIAEPPISFMKPDYLLKAEEEYASRGLTSEELRACQDKAISELIARQREAGLEVITDGAFRQTNGLRDFWMPFTGVRATVVLSGHLFQDQNTGEVIPKVVSKIAFNPSHEILNNYFFLPEEAGDGPVVRMDVPSPSLFYLDLVRNEWYDKSVYPDSGEMAGDIAVAYNATILALYHAGCRRLLLVDRSWGRLCDRTAAKRLIQGGIDLVDLPQRLLEINEKSLENIPDDMHIILYAPFESELRDECSDIVRHVFAHRRVDSFMIDMPERAGRFYKFLELFPEGKEIILGVEDSRQPQILPQERIRDMIAMVSEKIPRAKIRLTTRGGFTNNTDSIDFSAFDEPDQWHKLNNLML